MAGRITGLIGVAWAMAALCAPDAFSQTRSTLRLNTPGTLSTIGRTSGSTSTFSIYSYGLGSLSSRGTSGGGSVLSSSLSRGSGFSLRSSSSSASSNPLSSGMSALAPVGQSRTGKKLYNPMKTRLVLSSGGAGLRGATSSTLGAVEDYLGALGSASEQTSLNTRSKEITSFVPAEKSLFADYISSGERAFRAGDFGEAFNKFQLARHIASQAPEVLLSMAHAKFALSRNSFSSAAYYLREALKYFPELPLVAMKPAAFYGGGEVYTRHLIRLENYLRNNPSDGDAALYMAYLRWFAGDTEGAQAALSMALRTAIDTQNAGMAEAVSTFWDGCVASGRLSGKLQPTTRPAKPGSTDKAGEETAGTE